MFELAATTLRRYIWSTGNTHRWESDTYMNTTFIVGNGAVEGGWEPIKRAIYQTFGKCPDRVPNLVFANLTYQLRWLKYQSQKGNSDATTLFNQRYQTYEKLKNNICCEIKKACQCGLMRIRDEFNRASQRFAQGDICIATTNWDLLLKPYLKAQVNKLIYVHGNVSHPGSLYLPTESIVEPYRSGSVESCLHGGIAGGLMSVLQNTNRLVIYGLSLSPLDVELGLVICDGFHNTRLPDEVIVIDVYPSLVVDRLQYLGIAEVPNCYHPKEI